MIFAGIAVVTSISVPREIDRDARDREVRRICIDSVLELRSAVVSVTGQYSGKEPKPDSVLADWNATLAAAEQVRVSCRDLALPTAGGVEEKPQLWQQLDTAGNQARGGSHPDEAVTAGLIRWTTDAIKDLTATR
jgi:hypothetical protein